MRAAPTVKLVPNDPHSGRYVPYALGIMRLGGLATLVLLGIFLAVLWRREAKAGAPTHKEQTP